MLLFINDQKFPHGYICFYSYHPWRHLCFYSYHSWIHFCFYSYHWSLIFRPFADFLFDIVNTFITWIHGCVKSTVKERMQNQLGRMANFPPHVTFSVFDLKNHEVPQIKSQTMRHPLIDLVKGAFIYDVRCFSGIFDLPTYLPASDTLLHKLI